MAFVTVCSQIFGILNNKGVILLVGPKNEEKEVLVDSDKKIVFQIENEQNSSGAEVKVNESVTEKEVIDAKIEEDIVDIPDTFVGGVNETVYFNTSSNYGSNYLSRLWGRKRSTL